MKAIAFAALFAFLGHVAAYSADAEFCEVEYWKVRSTPEFVAWATADAPEECPLSVLQMAIFLGPAWVQGMLESGADPNVPDGNVRPLLRLAIESSHGDTRSIQLLLDAGADPNTLWYDEAVLHSVALIPVQRNTEIVGMLIAAGANPNIENSEGIRPLHVAAAMNQVSDLIEQFVSLGADVNAVDHHGHTPLYYACTDALGNGREGNAAVIAALVNLGARSDKLPQSASELCQKVPQMPAK